MAIALSNTWTVIQSSSTNSVTQGSQTISAGCAMFIFAASTAAVTSMTNSHSDVFTLLAAPADGSGIIVTIGYCPVATTGAGSSITVNFASSVNVATAAHTFTGLATTSILDRSVSTQSNPTGGNIPSGTTALTQFNNELILSLVSEGGGSNYTFTKDAAYTVAAGMNIGNGTSGRTMIVEYQIVAATSTYSATVTSTNSASNGNHLLATFSDTSVPSGTSASVAWLTA